MKRVVMRHIPESQTQRLMLERGDIDIGYGMAAPDLEALKSADGRQGPVDPRQRLLLSRRQHEGPGLANPKVRLALRTLIDYEGINRTIMPYYGELHQRPIQKGFMGSLPDPGYKLDPAKAKSLLAEAGYPDGFSVTLAHALRSAVPEHRDRHPGDAGPGRHQGRDHQRLRRPDLRRACGSATSSSWSAAAAAGSSPHPEFQPARHRLQPGQQRRGQADQLPGLAHRPSSTRAQPDDRGGPARAGPGQAGPRSTSRSSAATRRSSRRSSRSRK